MQEKQQQKKQKIISSKLFSAGENKKTSLPQNIKNEDFLKPKEKPVNFDDNSIKDIYYANSHSRNKVLNIIEENSKDLQSLGHDSTISINRNIEDQQKQEEEIEKQNTHQEDEKTFISEILSEGKNGNILVQEKGDSGVTKIIINIHTKNKKKNTQENVDDKGENTNSSTKIIEKVIEKVVHVPENHILQPVYYFLVGIVSAALGYMYAGFEMHYKKNYIQFRDSFLNKSNNLESSNYATDTSQTDPSSTNYDTKDNTLTKVSEEEDSLIFENHSDM